MKNLSSDIYRRETQDLVKKIMSSRNISIEQISELIQKTPAAIRRWLKPNGSLPTKKNFNTLKALAEGKVINSLANFRQEPPNDDILEIKYRMRQLTEQIQLVQETCGAIKERLTRIETDIGPQAGVRLSTLEQKIFGQPVTEPLKNKPEVSKM